jgi:hypothetical protein
VRRPWRGRDAQRLQLGEDTIFRDGVELVGFGADYVASEEVDFILADGSGSIKCWGRHVTGSRYPARGGRVGWFARLFQSGEEVGGWGGWGGGGVNLDGEDGVDG